MKTPVALLTEYLKGIDAQLKVCQEHNLNIELVEIEAQHYQNAIKVLQEFGFKKQHAKKQVKKSHAIKRALFKKKHLKVAV